MNGADIGGGTSPGSAGDYEELAAQAEREADDLKHQGDKLGDDIEDTKADWESKQADSSVPGALPDPGDEGDTADAEHGESAQDDPD